MFNWIKQYKSALLMVGILFSSAQMMAQDAQGDPAKGAELFKTNCTACHALDKKMIGPALGGIVEKLQSEENLGTDWLHKWIKDSQGVIASGDPYAKKLFDEYNNIPMTPFPNLSDQDIDDILAYTSNPPAEAAPAADAGAAAGTEAAAEGDGNKPAFEGTNELIFISIVIVAALLMWILYNSKKLKRVESGEDLDGKAAARVNMWKEFYDKYRNASNVIITILSLLAAYGVWNWLMWIGVYKGYKPDQPIHFSHKIHAGINKIDCQMCHSGAKYGKVSEIPSLNVCMNCHKAIPEYKGEYMEPGMNRAFYNDQIKKLYAAVGWEPENMAYNGNTKPIEWTRIHNMPDFVYFNHSQHVVAGEKTIIEGYNKQHPNDKIDVVCKACHGPVDTMNVVRMANDFTMGWCVECHRTTEVDMANGFNEAYFEKLHEKLKKEYGEGAKSKVTVDAIGGLECAKCHY